MLLVLGDVGDVTNRPGGIAVLREFTLEIEPPRTLFRVQQFDLKTFAAPASMRIGAALPAPASGSPALCGSIIL
ncbi:MAG: hypothetical protein ACLRWP_00010 [Bilophila wadsworthia]